MIQVLIDSATFLLILLLLVLAAWIWRPAPGPEPIYLKGGERYEENITDDAVIALESARGMVSPPQRTYFVAQYERPLTPSERTRLASEMDVRFLDAIPANSYIVSVPTVGGGPVMQRLLRSDPAARALVDVRHEDKLSLELYAFDPALGTIAEDVPAFIESPGPSGVTYQELFVRFYADVPVSKQRQLLKDYTDGVWDGHVDMTAPSYGLWTVLLPQGNLIALAERPEVQSIEPGPPATENDMDAAKPLVGVSAAVTETGNGVRIAQFEGCMADDSHNDLGNVTKIDVATANCLAGDDYDHATMVAGAMIGDGTDFANHTGIARDAEILAFDTEGYTSEIIDEYVVALLLGTHLTNSSFGFELNDLFYEVQSQPHLWYRTINGHYDRVTSARTASGTTVASGRQMTVIASTGNSGDLAHWGGTRVRNSAKNVITVGGISTGSGSAENAPMSQGGRGPTGDGRLSPLLVAPSIEHTDATAWGIKATVPVDTLGQGWGTSYSTPIVSGVAALATEKFLAVCNDGRPAPADIRAVLVHTARDLTAAGLEIYGKPSGSEVRSSSVHHPDINPALEYIGPDFVFGYGLVQADKAIQAIGGSRFLRGSIDQGVIEYPIAISSGSLDGDHLRVTLAWDDPPFSDSGAVPSPATGFLQNDLDLVVIDPNGKRHYPWVLDKNNPGVPATQSISGGGLGAEAVKRDRRNTVEQVHIEVPQALSLAGSNTWTIQVRGSNMLLGPQAFTLVSEAIKPATMCGEIPSVVIPFPPQPPGNPFDFEFLYLALFMLAILLFVLVRWVYYHYVQITGPLRAALMALLALFVVLFVLFLLLQWAVVLVAFVIAFFVAYFYANSP
ncbi:MAG: S8 family serine peptidase [Woeseiaceae bacterium]